MEARKEGMRTSTFEERIKQNQDGGRGCASGENSEEE